MNKFDYQILKAMLSDRQVYEQHGEAVTFRDIHLHNIYAQIKLYYLHNSTADSIAITDLTTTTTQLYKDSIYNTIIEDINSTTINNEYIDELTSILHNRYTICMLNEATNRMLQEQQFDSIEELKDIANKVDVSTNNDISSLSLSEVTTAHEGLKWPWPTLHDHLGLLPPGSHGLIAARVEVGKTAFAVNCVLNFMRQGARVLHINNEDPLAKLLERYYMIYWGKEKAEILNKAAAYSAAFEKKFGELLFLYDTAAMNLSQLKKKVKQHKPHVVLIDQVDGMSKDLDAATLEKLYAEIRNVAKNEDTRALSVTQASHGENSYLDMGDLHWSKVGKQAAVDYFIGIGKNDYDNKRFISLPKNKLTGAHSKFDMLFDPVTMRYVE